MGRPLIGDKPLKERIFVLVSDETKKKLEVCKNEWNMTASDVVRKGIDKMYNELKNKGSGSYPLKHKPLSSPNNRQRQLILQGVCGNIQ